MLGSSAESERRFGVAARVRLDRDVVRRRHVAGELRLLGGDRALLHQRADDAGRRRPHELPGRLGAGDLRDQPVARHYSPVLPPQPGNPVPYHVRREAHVGGRLDAADAAAQVELDRVAFQPPLGGAVDEVHRERQPGNLGGEPGQRRVDRLRQQAGRAVAGQEALACQGGDELDRGDPVGHGPGHVGVARPVRLTERWRAEPVRGQRRGRAEHRQPPSPGSGRAAGHRADARRGDDDETGTLQVGQRLADPDRIGAGRQLSIPPECGLVLVHCTWLLAVGKAGQACADRISMATSVIS